MLPAAGFKRQPAYFARIVVALSLFGMSVIFAMAFARLRDEQPSETIRPATLNNKRGQAKPVRANELPRMASACS